MKSNLLENIKQGITPAFIDKLSNYLDESRDSTSNSVTAVIPTVLAYLSDYSHTDKGAETIYNAATDTSLNTLFADNDFQGVFEKNRNALVAKGNAFISELFGGKAEGLESEISKYANIKRESSKGILSSLLPFILNTIGNAIKDRSLTQSTLSNLFDEQKNNFYSAVPSGLASLGGILGLSNFSKDLSSATPTATTTKTIRTDNVKPNLEPNKPKTFIKENEEKSGGMMKWLLPLLGIIAAALLIYFLTQRCNEDKNVDNTTLATDAYETYTLNDQNLVINSNGENVLDNNENQIVVDGTTIMLNDDNFVVDAEENYILDNNGKKIKIDKNLAVSSSLNAAVAGKYDSIRNAYVYDVGQDKEITLPDGTVIIVGEKSSEAQIYNFLNDNNLKVSEDKTQGWITLDRIYFDTNSSKLTSDSYQQLENVANILKNFPNATAKFGGYTDSAGGQEVNQPLSDARAKSALDQVVENGIDPSRLESEGYGQNHFVCPANDTPECMAKNRRVDIRITRK